MIKILHLPKTGGTVLKASLAKDYKVYLGEQIQSVIPDVYLTGHDEVYKRNKFKYVFFVRDPIDRFISHFYYFKHGTQYDTSAHFTGPRNWKQRLVNVSLDKFIEKSSSDMFLEFISKKHRSLHELVEHVDSSSTNIVMVGTMENLQADFYTLQKLLDQRDIIELNTTYTNKRPNHIKVEISSESKSKLRLLLDKEYQALHKLVTLGYLSQDYLDSTNYNL